MNSNALRELLVPNVGHGAGVHPRPCSFQNSHGLLELSELQRLKSIYIVAGVLNQASTAVGEIAILRAIVWAAAVACAGCGLEGWPNDSDKVTDAT